MIFRLGFMAVCMALGAVSALAGPLTDAYKQAIEHDPLFQGAKLERDANVIASQAAGAAYYPQFQASYQQLEVENSTRQTYALTQPLINADKYASLREAGPREVLAAATLAVREQDLAARLLKGVTDLLKHTESQRLNAAKIEALTKQAASAKKAFELGQGTVTDLRDAQVRVAQAHADSLALEVQISSHQRQISAITGAPAQSLMLSVPRGARNISLKDQESFVAQALGSNPHIRVALQNQKLAEINTLRADGAFLPVLNGVYTSTSNSLSSNNYFGVTVSLPFQAASIYQRKGAATQVARTQEQTRELEQKTRLEVQRFWSLVSAGLQELPIRLAAIEAAQFSVEANEKSFKGGVRSQIDVLNSIQTLFQVQQDYVNTVLALSENYLNLLLQSATPTDQAMALVQALLLPAQAR